MEKYQTNWAKKVVVQGNSTSDPFYIPDHFNEFSIGVAPGPGNAIIQFSISTKEDIESGNANWHDWTLGNVSSGVDGLTFPIMAIRLTTTTSNPKTMEICG